MTAHWLVECAAALAACSSALASTQREGMEGMGSRRGLAWRFNLASLTRLRRVAATRQRRSVAGRP
jgi:hypothetical protein